MGSGRNIRVYNNITDHYAEGIRLRNASPRLAGVSIANNLFIETSELAFQMPGESLAYFDHNVSSSAKPLLVQIDSATRELAEYLAGASMPNTKLAKGVDLLDRDLGRLTGISVVDAGKAVGDVRSQARLPTSMSLKNRTHVSLPPLG